MPRTSALLSLTAFHDEIKLESSISRESEILISVPAAVACCLEGFPEEGFIVGWSVGESLDELKSFIFGRISRRHTAGISASGLVRDLSK